MLVLLVKFCILFIIKFSLNIIDNSIIILVIIVMKFVIFGLFFLIIK